MQKDEGLLKMTALRALSQGTLPHTPPLSFAHRGLQIVLICAQDPEAGELMKKSRMLPEVEQEILEKFGLGMDA